ncbi:hypothetical protein ANCCAN_13743 [Ancylostoma caninum]|uniref:Uncharacterized protein n=1 Tax=Ancylostoma caninum TaxID=29170 RepID=A0A368GAL7_ANCCA|nr:hypothetical protein ANCCAN_13743 [Ancylostoma caninum]
MRETGFHSGNPIQCFVIAAEFAWSEVRPEHPPLPVVASSVTYIKEPPGDGSSTDDRLSRNGLIFHLLYNVERLLVLFSILLTAIAASQAQVAVNGPFYGRYYSAAKPVLTPGFAQVGAPVVAAAAPVVAAAPAPVFAAPAPAPAPVLAAPAFAPAPAPILAAPAPAVRPVMAAPFMAAPVARPVFAAPPAPVMAAPAVAAFPAFAAPPAPVVAAPPAPVFAAPPAPVLAAPPAPVLAAPVMAAAPAYVPAYAPFVRTPYFIGSNKSKN